jgi:hypothetical protein
LLFQQLGALGVVLVGVCGTLLWLLHREQDEHATTRKHVEVINEKRLELATQTLHTLHGLKDAIDAVGEEIKRRRPR